MSDSRLFDQTYRILGKSLDISSRRNSLISANIANMDTIGYKPKDIDFQKALKNAMEKKTPEMSQTHRKHFSGISPNFVNMWGETQYEPDEQHLDSVNIDTEMSNLAENNIKYRTTAEMLIRKISILKHAISEGGR